MGAVDETRREKLGRFRSDEARERFDLAYAAALETWPMPVRSNVVATRFGPPRVNACGAATGTPIVLLHGMMLTSVSWAPNVAALGAAHPVYAVDTICDAGMSTQQRPVRGGEDLASWLDEVLAGLELGSAHLVGLSYGSWIGINQALRAPARLASVTAIEPPGVITRGKPKLMLQFIRAGVTRTDRAFERLAKVLGNGDLPPAPIYEVLRCGFLDFKVVQPFAKLVNDDQLRSIATPLLLMYGEDSPMSNGARAVERAKRLVPDLETDLVAGTAHTPPLEAPDVVNDRVLSFIDSVDGRT